MITRTKSKNGKHVFLSIKSILRGYTYTAKLTARTGKLMSVTAGCRYWSDWHRAEAFYAAQETPWHVWRPKEWEGPDSTCRILVTRWTDRWLSLRTGDDREAYAKLYAARLEAQMILQKLRSEHSRYWQRQDRRRARERKAKRAK